MIIFLFSAFRTKALKLNPPPAEIFGKIYQIYFFVFFMISADGNKMVFFVFRVAGLGFATFIRKVAKKKIL